MGDVIRQPRECSHAVNGLHCQRPSQRITVVVRDRDAAGEGWVDVPKVVLGLDDQAERRTCRDAAGRLRGDHQSISHVESGRRDGGQSRAGGYQRIAVRRFADRQSVERGHAVDRLHSQRTAQRGAARIRTQGQRDVTVERRGDVAKLVFHVDRHVERTEGY